MDGLFTSSGDSLLVSAASPSSFGHVVTSGLPVSKASPAISLFEVLLQCVACKNLGVQLTALVPVTQLLMLLYKPGKRKPLRETVVIYNDNIFYPLAWQEKKNIYKMHST